MAKLISKEPKPAPTDPTPLVTVVIPAYNVERYLREAIESAFGRPGKASR
jgi:cellulose synthase/poly-beta-1,6-N-acetylglucosamine synthase-like glycosyltransferase